MRKLIHILFPLIAGGIYPLGFAPFGWHFIGYLSPLLLLALLHKKTAKEGFKLGFLWGLGAFGFGASWVYVSIHQYGNTSVVLASFITLVFVAFLSLYSGALGYLLNRVFKALTLTRHVIGFATLWVSLDLVRGWFLTGFPWLYVGYTQVATPLKGYAPLFGIWGVSFFTICISGFLFQSYVDTQSNRLKGIYSLFGVFAIVGVGLVLEKVEWTKTTDVNAKVAMIQGSIPQEIRWDDAYVMHTLNTYAQMTKEISEDYPSIDIIVWPESAIPVELTYSYPFLHKVIDQLNERTTLITGVPETTPDEQFYNSIRAFGNGKGVYYKKHLVPFGEYVPFERLLRGLIGFFDIPMSNFVSGPKKANILHAPPLDLAPAICYEIAYPNSLRETLKDNETNAIITISNDAWFGHSIGPHQHEEIAKMRALESQLPVIRSTNSGITAIIYPNRPNATMPAFVEASLIASVPKMTGKTPWVNYGPFPFFIFIWLLSLTLIIRGCRPTKT